ncbi:MAG: DEAD/DEAH box helicase [Flavobacteriales bacterium]|nr:DEAD/DEAH box helicase [Flavobacteriales bacterium]
MGERSKRRPKGKFHKSFKRTNQQTKPVKKDYRKSSKNSSNVNPLDLIKKAVKVEEKPYEAKRNFNEMPLSSALKERLEKKGFVRPTEIQDKAILDLMDGKNMLGIAKTGTGKTGAFLIPIIEDLLNYKQTPHALITAPTRELATQIHDEFKSMTKGLKLYSACFIGGTNINKDLNILRRVPHVVIGTPGRILDLVKRKSLDLRRFKVLVLDEFDRMLDMGFLPDVTRIVNFMKQRSQTMLFSATLDTKQQKHIDEILLDPVTVKVSDGKSTGDQIEQDVIVVSDPGEKFGILKEMLSDKDFAKVILFEESKYKVRRLCDKLNKSGFKADQIHGDKSQNARQKALNSFKEDKIQVLVATDVAARGIDVSNVTHVINFQLPRTYDSYIHRIGRTGRSGKLGMALTFVTQEEMNEAKKKKVR